MYHVSIYTLAGAHVGTSRYERLYCARTAREYWVSEGYNVVLSLRMD